MIDQFPRWATTSPANLLLTSKGQPNLRGPLASSGYTGLSLPFVMDVASAPLQSIVHIRPPSTQGSAMGLIGSLNPFDFGSMMKTEPLLGQKILSTPMTSSFPALLRNQPLAMFQRPENPYVLNTANPLQQQLAQLMSEQPPSDEFLMNELLQKQARRPSMSDELDEMIAIMKLFKNPSKQNAESLLLNDLTEWILEGGDGFGTARRRRLLGNVDMDYQPSHVSQSYVLANEPQHIQMKLFPTQFMEQLNQAYQPLKPTAVSEDRQSTMKVVEVIPVTQQNMIPQTTVDQIENIALITTPSSTEGNFNEQLITTPPLETSSPASNPKLLRVPNYVEQRLKLALNGLPGHEQGSAILHTIGQVDTSELWGSFQPRRVIGTLLSNVFPFNFTPLDETQYSGNNAIDSNSRLQETFAATIGQEEAPKRNIIPLERGIHLLGVIAPALPRIF